MSSTTEYRQKPPKLKATAYVTKQSKYRFGIVDPTPLPKPIVAQPSSLVGGNPARSSTPKRKKTKLPRKKRQPRPRTPKRTRAPSPEEVTKSPAVVFNYYHKNSPESIPTVVNRSWADGGELGVYNRKVNKAKVKTTDFLLLRKQRKLPQNAYSLNSLKSSGTPYQDYSVTINEEGTGYPTTTVYWSDCRAFDNTPPLSYGFHSFQATDYLARKRLAETVNKASVNLGVMFAERQQTANLIGNTARRIAEAAYALRKGNLRGVSDVLGISSRDPGWHSSSLKAAVQKTDPSKRVSNYWLEIQFGWKPLLSDIYGSAELLARHAVGWSHHSTATASASQVYNKSFKRPSDLFTGNGTVGCRTRYVANYRLDNYARAAFDSLGITNPLTVAWEILPYSFVVDWFIDVSGFLKTLNAFDGFEYVSGTISRTAKGKMIKNFSLSYSGGYGGGVSGSSAWDQVSYERQPQNTFPPSVPPTLRNPLDKDPTWTFLTSLALLRQLFK